MSALETFLFFICAPFALLALWCLLALVVTLIHRFDEWIEGEWWR